MSMSIYIAHRRKKRL